MQNLLSLHEEVLKANLAVENSDDNIEINHIIENIIRDITDAEYASIWIYNEHILTRKRSITDIVNLSMNRKEGLLYQCFAKEKAGIYNYLRSEKGYIAEVDNPDDIRIKSKIMIPLVLNDVFLGIVTAYSTIRKIKKFTNDDLEVFNAITPFMRNSINKMKMNSNLTSAMIVEISDNTSVDNLKEVQESRENTKAPDEILNYVSNIVHDIRTPANGLLGFLDILQEQIKDERLKEYVCHARNSALLISDLTTSILDGVSAKKEPERKEPTTVNTIKYFSDIADIFSANMSKKEISYNIFVDPLLPKEIELNSMKIKRVIMNLIGNASKFTPEKGCIEFSVRYKKKEKKLHIYVKDNGIGIAKEKQKDIFEAFKQAEDDTKDLYGGTGLGLSICAAYVKDMGGKLLIDSELDKGSIFYFDLPMEIKDYAKKFTPIEDKSKHITILMDKDNLCTTNHIARYLVKMGMNVDSISAVSKLSLVSKNTTHLITFEQQLSGDIFMYVKQKNIQHLVIEEEFLALEVQNLDGAKLISKFTDMGETLYTFLNDNNKPKVLIVEDDKVTITLLKTILMDEYCHIDIAHDGQEGLELLKQALNDDKPYSVVYTDQNMPILSGEDMIRLYSKLPKDDVNDKLTTVSISGDIVSKVNRHLFDICAHKPFRKVEIIDAFLKATKKQGV